MKDCIIFNIHLSHIHSIFTEYKQYEIFEPIIYDNPDIKADGRKKIWMEQHYKTAFSNYMELYRKSGTILYQTLLKDFRLKHPFQSGTFEWIVSEITRIYQEIQKSSKLLLKVMFDRNKESPLSCRCKEE